MREEKNWWWLKVSLVVAALGLIWHLVKPAEFGFYLLNFGLGMAQILGLLLMLKKARITHSVYYRAIRFLVGLGFLGMLLKILHWPGANFVLMGIMLAIAITYTVWFFKKKTRGHLDILKLIWVLSAFIGGALILEHLIPQQFSYFTISVFWITFLDFYVLQQNARVANKQS